MGLGGAEHLRSRPSYDSTAVGTRIAIGSDHAGFELKQHLVECCSASGHDVDRPRHRFAPEPVDYPPICAAVGRAVRDGEADVGIVLGGSGQGEQLAANKVRGVRAALCNASTRPAWPGPTTTPTCCRSAPGSSASASPRRSSTSFLATPFDGGRHARRVDQITALEEEF